MYCESQNSDDFDGGADARYQEIQCRNKGLLSVIGQVINSRYEICSVLKNNNSNLLFKCADILTGGLYALKFAFNYQMIEKEINNLIQINKQKNAEGIIPKI